MESSSAVWTLEQISAVHEKSQAQCEMASAAKEEAERQYERAARRCDRARQRALQRVVPMWLARKACYDGGRPVLAMSSPERLFGKDEPGGEQAGTAAKTSTPPPDLASPLSGPVGDVINGLFEVSLLVSCCRSMAPPLVAEKLDQAIDKIDDLIRQFRLVVCRGPAAPDGAIGGIVARLEDAAARLSGPSASAAAPPAVRLQEAAAHINQALSILSEGA